MPSSSPYEGLEILNNYVDLDIDTTIDQTPYFEGKVNEFVDSDQRYVFSDNPKWEFTINRRNMTDIERQNLLNFFVARKGAYEEFQFKDPRDNEYWKVRFKDFSLTVTRGDSINLYNTTITLRSTE